MPDDDAFLYSMNVAAAAEINVIAGRVHRVVLDFAFKKAIRRHGCAHTEAGFLSLVAPHGGDDFTRRQFDAWIGVERGKRSENFLADLLDLGHRRRHIFARNRQVSCVRFRPLSRPVAGENNRYRPDHQPQAIQARLAALNHVLDHSEIAAFATKREKLAPICDESGIAPEALPAKVYTSANGCALTRRYCLDRFPIFGRPSAEEPALLLHRFGV